MGFIFVISGKNETGFVALLTAALTVRGLDLITYKDLGRGTLDLTIKEAISHADFVLLVRSRKQGNDPNDNQRLSFERGVALEVNPKKLVEIRRGKPEIDRVNELNSKSYSVQVDLLDWPAPLPWFTPDRQPPIEEVATILQGKPGSPAPVAVVIGKSAWERANYWLVRQWNAKIRSSAALALSALIGSGSAFAFNLNNTQETVCSVRFVDDFTMSDFCGDLGLGKKASRPERLAWEAIPKQANSCDAYRAFNRRFGQKSVSDLPARATNILGGAINVRSTEWVNSTQTIRMNTPVAFDKGASIAKEIAEERVSATAENDCRPAIVSEFMRFVAVGEVKSVATNCNQISSSLFACTATFEADCKYVVRPLIEVCDPTKEAKP